MDQKAISQKAYHYVVSNNCYLNIFFSYLDMSLLKTISLMYCNARLDNSVLKMCLGTYFFDPPSCNAICTGYSRYNLIAVEEDELCSKMHFTLDGAFLCVITHLGKIYKESRRKSQDKEE